eukprot:Phypoly_transcript_01791.p1 GENE.Phypoly_transcript_01791~~Phypoly_transcript_01791.p1  ORF type:complete len:915 (+),score=141.77 Phypoly_transcript_01791:306-3050(+)
MRTQFPTSLNQEDVIAYVKYLGVVGGIFVIVALFLYITVIAFAIASRKWKRFSSEQIAKLNEIQRRKGHIIFIVITILVFFLVVEAVIFGLVENSRLNKHVVQIATKPTTVLTPAAQVILNVNKTVGATANSLDHSILLIERVLVSVATIETSIDNIRDAILDVQQEFGTIESQVLNATNTLIDTQSHIHELSTYQDQGYISGVPDPSQVQTVNDTIDNTITSATDYLNNTINTVNDVLVNVNTTIAKAVDTGNTEVQKAKVVLNTQIAKIQSTIGKAVRSLHSPNETISSISHTSIKYANLLKKILIAVFVFALIPLILVFIGLVAKVPMLYKFAFALSFACMFWLIAIGGVFAVVHTAFSQACDSREVLVINGIHKFTPDEYRVNLGHISIGPNGAKGDTEVIIPLNTTTLRSLLSCSNPTNFFDVFGLESLIDSIFGQIYDELDQLQQEQSEFFNSNSTSNYVDTNLHDQIANTTDGVSGFQGATQDLVSGSYLDNFYGIRGTMENITYQATNLSAQANETVNDALSSVNNITQNVTTTTGDYYSYYYTLSNISDLDPTAYPYSATTPEYQANLNDAHSSFAGAVQNQGTISQKVSSIVSEADLVITDIEKFQATLKSSFGVSVNVNSTVQEIQNELHYVADLIPELYQNITDAIDSVRNVLETVADSLRHDTQCGFAGEFYTTFSDEICRTSKKNAQAMCAALLIMGISYFFVCILGVGLLKRNDVHKLMDITEKGIQKIASARVINRTLSMVNTVVRQTSEVFKPMRGASSRNVHVPKEGDGAGQPTEVIDVPDENFRISRASVRFADAPCPPGSPPPQINRHESLSQITSALRNTMHKRTPSHNREIGQAQEIPYAQLSDIEMQGIQSSSSSDSVADSQISKSGETSKSDVSNNNNDTKPIIKEEDKE